MSHLLERFFEFLAEAIYTGKRGISNTAAISKLFADQFAAQQLQQVLQDQLLQNQLRQEEWVREQMEFAQGESIKAVTPFDHGGYVQGEGFNPSDTFHAEAARSLSDMGGGFGGGCGFGGGFGF